jgi:hypothetical protein
MPLLLIASFAVLWYAVHEATPLKPFPDFSRHMLPLAPLLIILGASLIYELAARWDHRGILAAIVLALAAVPALLMSVQINATDVDPRGVVPSIVAASGARAILDRYSDYEQNRRILGIRHRPTKDMADIVVTSNLAYDRFALDAAPSGMAAYYRGLSAKPHLDVSNGRPTVGYFNPALPIVAMDGSVDRLRRISAEIEAAAPSLKVELIEPPNSGE